MSIRNYRKRIARLESLSPRVDEIRELIITDGMTCEEATDVYISLIKHGVPAVVEDDNRKISPEEAEDVYFMVMRGKRA